jgi:hypothetical protein
MRLHHVLDLQDKTQHSTAQHGTAWQSSWQGERTIHTRYWDAQVLLAECRHCGYSTASARLGPSDHAFGGPRGDTTTAAGQTRVVYATQLKSTLPFTLFLFAA